MATIERRNDRFRVIFYHSGRRHTSSLKTDDLDEANRIAGSVERTLSLIRQGSLRVPDSADFVQFVLSAGHQTQLPKCAIVRTFKELRDRYLEVMSIGVVESNSLLTIRIHLDHMTETLGAHFAIQELGLGDLQQHVSRRAKETGRRGRNVQAATLKKEIATFRACWNWALEPGLVKARYPNKGLKFPKAVEKLPFMTYSEIERKVAGLSALECDDLWDALFLTGSEIDELLRHVRQNARLDWLYPMFVFAAHTGARRSELIRAKVADIDFPGDSVLIWECKKDKSRHTYRRVPLTPLLKVALEEWLPKRPCGPNLFCHNERASQSKKKNDPLGVPLTRKEVADHFQRTLQVPKWERLKGWHVLRHSFISICAHSVSPVILDQWSGHQTEEMRRRYTHLIPSEERRAIASAFEPKRE